MAMRYKHWEDASNSGKEDSMAVFLAVLMAMLHQVDSAPQYFTLSSGFPFHSVPWILEK